MSRILCFVQVGASYQCSAERMSRRPSLLKSATATLSLNPGSIICTLKAMSAGRVRTGSCATGHARVSKANRTWSMSSPRRSKCERALYDALQAIRCGFRLKAEARAAAAAFRLKPEATRELFAVQEEIGWV